MKREEFANNVTHGKLEMFYEDGTPQRLAYYKEGKRNGSYLEYYPNGRLKSRDEYVDDLPNGASETYFDKVELMLREQ